jgi:SAM-dependent MidA family methyltransferase
MNICAHPALAQALEAELRSGPIPFKRFMELSLNHPEGGYYRQPSPRVGRGGDFKTSPHQSPWFGRMLARQAEEIWSAMGRPSLFSVYEFGPGEGWLAHDLLEEIEANCPDTLSGALEYILIEQSASASDRMRERLSRWMKGAPGLPGARLETPGNFNLPGQFEGLVIAHEYLDALPVHILVQAREGLAERYVELRDGRLSMREGPLSDEKLGGWFEDLGIEIEIGQMAEVCPAALEWTDAVSRNLRRGGALLFDYGFSSRVLYHPSRREGTIRGYRDHTLIDDPLENPGETDLTAHVDFTSILRAAEAGGLALAGFTDQTHFLLGAGITEAIEKSGGSGTEAAGDRRGAMGLLDPGGLGGAIKVMLLSRGLGDAAFPAFSMKPGDRESLATLRG